MLQVVLFKVPDPSVETSDSQARRQDRCERWFWKAREAELVKSAGSRGRRTSKVRRSLRRVWLPGRLTPSGRTSRRGRRRWPEFCRSPHPGFSQSASRSSPGDHPPPGCPGCGRKKPGHERLGASLPRMCSGGKEAQTLGERRQWMRRQQLLCAGLPWGPGGEQSASLQCRLGGKNEDRELTPENWRRCWGHPGRRCHCHSSSQREAAKQNMRKTKGNQDRMWNKTVKWNLEIKWKC